MCKSMKFLSYHQTKSIKLYRISIYLTFGSGWDEWFEGFAGFVAADANSEYGLWTMGLLYYKESKFADKKEEKKPETKESENMAKKEGENEEKEI